MTLVELAATVDFSDVGTKPLRYYELYDQYFGHLQSEPIKMLELGVYRGESLKVFGSYFSAGTIVGIDIADYGCDLSAFPNVHFEFADQRNPYHLNDLCDKYAPDGLDIVIDDCSHVGSYSWASYTHLLPRLKPGGLYIVEDWATGYWDDWPDGSRYQPVTEDPYAEEPPKRLPSHDFGMVGLIKRFVDEAAWQAIRSNRTAPSTNPKRLEYMHVHPSFVVLQKALG